MSSKQVPGHYKEREVTQELRGEVKGAENGPLPSRFSSLHLETKIAPYTHSSGH